MYKYSVELNEAVWRFRARIASESPGTWHQLDRSAGSVFDNIAEGFGRESRPDFANYLRFATGSAMEAQAQIARALRRELISEAESRAAQDKLDSIIGMLRSFRKYLKQTKKPSNALHEDPIPYGEPYWPSADQLPIWWHQAINQIDL